jgi:hypothetical protein
METRTRRPQFLALIAAILALFQWSGCGPSPSKSLDSEEKEAVRKEATQMLHDYHDAIRKGGLLTEFEFLDSSQDFFWIPPGVDALMGYEAVKKAIMANVASIDSMSTHWVSLQVHPLSQDIGKLSSYTISKRADSTGIKMDTSRVTMLESGTMIRRANGWKLLSGQTVVLGE